MSNFLGNICRPMPLDGRLHIKIHNLERYRKSHTADSIANEKSLRGWTWRCTLYQLPTPQQADKLVIIFLARLVTVVVRLYSLVRIILSLPSIVYIHNGNSYRYPTRYGSVSTIQPTATTTDRPTATKNINFCTTPSLFRETTVISTHNKNSIAVAHHG